MPDEKTEREKQTVATMIGIYCKGKHHSDTLCDECQSLLEYARQRLSQCMFAPDKPFCKNCKVHCYQPDKRAQIRNVMRYAGPRVFFDHPGLTLKHVWKSVR